MVVVTMMTSLMTMCAVTLVRRAAVAARLTFVTVCAVDTLSADSRSQTLLLVPSTLAPTVGTLPSTNVGVGKPISQVN